MGLTRVGGQFWGGGLALVRAWVGLGVYPGDQGVSLEWGAWLWDGGRTWDVGKGGLHWG